MLESLEVTDVIQAILAATALWYAVETRGLRLQGARQLSLLEEQSKLAITPYVMPSAYKVEYDSESSPVYARNKSPLRSADISVRVKDTEKITFIVQVENQTPNLATSIRCVVYDPTLKNFLQPAHSLENINARESNRFCIVDQLKDRDEVESLWQAKYGPQASRFFDLLDRSESHYCLLIYQDVAGKLHAARRDFDIDEAGQTLHKTTTLSHEE